MPANSPVRNAILDLIDEVLEERQTIQQDQGNESGIVTQMNSDGSVTVQTDTSGLVTCNTPVQRVPGQQVVVITAGTMKIAI